MRKQPSQRWYVKLSNGTISKEFKNEKAARDWCTKHAPGGEVFLDPVLCDIDISELHAEDLASGAATQSTRLTVFTVKSGVTFMILTKSMAKLLRDYFIQNGLSCRIVPNQVGPAEKTEDQLVFDNSDAKKVEAALKKWRASQNTPTTGNRGNKKR
jgi:hypothetical protein